MVAFQLLQRPTEIVDTVHGIRGGQFLVVHDPVHEHVVHCAYDFLGTVALCPLSCAPVALVAGVDGPAVRGPLSSGLLARRARHHEYGCDVGYKSLRVSTRIVCDVTPIE